VKSDLLLRVGLCLTYTIGNKRSPYLEKIAFCYKINTLKSILSLVTTDGKSVSQSVSQSVNQSWCPDPSGSHDKILVEAEERERERERERWKG
jgi:hypothetical protein